MRRFLYLVTKKCRIYAACGVSQTPIYNSLRKESGWLPSYMKNYEDSARPFWTTNYRGDKVGDYSYIKEVLGF